MNNTPTPIDLDNFPLNEALRFADENSTTGGLVTQAALKTLAAKCRELTAVTEERDDFNKELEIANLRLKGKRHPDDNGIMGDGEIDIKALIESNDTLSKDRELWRKIAIYNGLQSDRLAEALERIADYQGRFAEEDPESIAREALAAVKGDNHES